MSDDQAIALQADAMRTSCLCHRARMATRAITRAYDDALRPTGLRAGQAAVLAALAGQGAASIQELADDLAMDRSTLTRNLRPLEARGLVALATERRHRARGLSLTDAGRATLAKLLPLWEAAQDGSRARLGEAGWASAQGALDQVIAAMTA